MWWLWGLPLSPRAAPFLLGATQGCVVAAGCHPRLHQPCRVPPKAASLQLGATQGCVVPVGWHLGLHHPCWVAPGAALSLLAATEDCAVPTGCQLGLNSVGCTLGLHYLCWKGSGCHSGLHHPCWVALRAPGSRGPLPKVPPLLVQEIELLAALLPHVCGSIVGPHRGVATGHAS